MRFHFTTVPLHDSAGAESELNAFLAAHRVLSVDRQLVVDGPRSVWALCVAYTERPATEGQGAGARSVGKPGPKIDYRELLPPAEFERYARLRATRKALAEAEGVPAYAVFTNEQLAEIVRRAPATVADLRSIEGVSDVRIGKYGEAMLQALRDAASPADRP